jgi:hypothetical protein
MYCRPLTVPTLSADPAAVGLLALKGIHVDGAERPLWEVGFAVRVDAVENPDGLFAAPTEESVPSKLPGAATSMVGPEVPRKLPAVPTVPATLPIVERTIVPAPPPVKLVTLAVVALAACRPTVVTVATVRVALALAPETTEVRPAVTWPIEERVDLTTAGADRTGDTEAFDAVAEGAFGVRAAGTFGADADRGADVTDVLGRVGDVGADADGADGTAEVAVEVADVAALVA